MDSNLNEVSSEIQMLQHWFYNPTKRHLYHLNQVNFKLGHRGDIILWYAKVDRPSSYGGVSVIDMDKWPVNEPYLYGHTFYITHMVLSFYTL